MRVVIINGCGGVGKDTVVEIAQKYLPFPVENISVIQRVKAVAGLFGWTGEKSAKDRRLLSDLKDTWQRYNDTPRRWVISAVNDFKDRGETDLVFVHARNPEDIRYLSNIFEPTIEVTTLLVRRPGIIWYGNDADDRVENYNYEHYLENDGDLDMLEKKVLKFLWGIGYSSLCGNTETLNARVEG